MTLSDLVLFYAPEMPIKLALYDKADSVYILNFEDAADHDLEIFQRYQSATVLAWYVVREKNIATRIINVELDIDKF